MEDASEIKRDVNEGVQANPQATEPHLVWWNQIIEYIKLRMEMRRAKKTERLRNNGTITTAKATTWIAVFTLIFNLGTFCILLGQLCVLRGQLNEMHDEGVDTHNLAEAAGIQAIGTTFLASAANTQAKASSEIADNAAKQVATATKALYLEQRAWVGIEVVRVNPLLPKGSSVIIVAHNTGKTPALMFHYECCHVFDGQIFGDEELDYDKIEAKNEAERKAKLEEMLNKRIIRDPTHADQIRQSVRKQFEEMDRVWKDQEAIGVIPPDGTRQIPFDIAAPANNLYHYHVGRLTYRDIIDPTKQHTTKFCLVSFGDGPLTYCDKGQDMN